jgi:hypothetical protein
VIALIGLVVFAACTYLGALIGFSFDYDLAAFVYGLIGLLIGSAVGVFVAIAVAKFFADHVWPVTKGHAETNTAE